MPRKTIFSGDRHAEARQASMRPRPDAAENGGGDGNTGRPPLLQ